MNKVNIFLRNRINSNFMLLLSMCTFIDNASNKCFAVDTILNPTMSDSE